MKLGSWPSIFATYAFAVIGVSSIAKFIPLRAEFAQLPGATPAQFAWLIALLGIPAALFASVSGALVDRVGPRTVLMASGFLAALVDCCYYLAPTMRVFQALRLVEGLTLVGIFTAGPALLMGSTEGKRRIAAMTFWSTYTPTGFSLGLLLGGAFAATPDWRRAFLMHAALILGVTCLAFGLPHLPRIADAARATALDRLRAVFGAYADAPVMRLACAFFLMVSVGFGASTVLPSFIARSHGISAAGASKLIAGTNLTMIVGAFSVGALLARGVPPFRVMLVLACGACCSALAMFRPATPLGWIVPVLCCWFLFMGGGTALMLAMLPRAAAPARRGAAAGLFNQASSIATFANPPVWLAVLAAGGWWPFVALVATCWLGAAAVFWAVHEQGPGGASPQNPRS